MGEAKRKRFLGLMPAKTTPAPADKKQSAAPTARKQCEILLANNIANIKGSYQQALRNGIEKPVVIISDTDDPYGQNLLMFMDERGRQINQEYAEIGLTPTCVMAVPLDKTSLQLFGDMLEPNGAQRLRMVCTIRDKIPCVVIAGNSHLFAAVPEQS